MKKLTVFIGTDSSMTGISLNCCKKKKRKKEIIILTKK